MHLLLLKALAKRRRSVYRTRQHTSAHVSTRQHTSAYVSIRQRQLLATAAAAMAPARALPPFCVIQDCLFRYLGSYEATCSVSRRQRQRQLATAEAAIASASCPAVLPSGPLMLQAPQQERGEKNCHEFVHVRA
jgi:hypothetical protein